MPDNSQNDFTNPLIRSLKIAEPNSLDLKILKSIDFNPEQQVYKPCNSPTPKPRIFKSEALHPEIMHPRPETLFTLFRNVVNPEPSICRSWTLNANTERRNPESERFRSWVSVGPGRDLKLFFKEEVSVVGWGVAGGGGWLGKGVRLEYQRGPNHGGGGACLTGSHVPQDGRTPLHLAAKNDHAAVVGALLTAEVDKEAKDRVRGGGVLGESGVGRCGMGSRPTCGLVCVCDQKSMSIRCCSNRFLDFWFSTWGVRGSSSCKSNYLIPFWAF